MKKILIKLRIKIIRDQELNSVTIHSKVTSLISEEWEINRIQWEMDLISTGLELQESRTYLIAWTSLTRMEWVIG